MGKPVKRFFVDVTLELFVPDQGYTEKGVKNTKLDAEYMANAIANKIPELVNENMFEYAERPYHINDAMLHTIKD